MENKEQDGEMFTTCLQDEETSAVQGSQRQTTEDFKIMTKHRKSVKCSNLTFHWIKKQALTWYHFM